MSNFVKFSSLLTLNYDNTDGIKKDFDFSQGGGYAKIGYQFNDNWNSNIDYNLNKFCGSDPSYVNENNPEPYRQHIIRGASSLNVNNYYNRNTDTLKLFYSYGNLFIQDPNTFHSTDDH